MYKRSSKRSKATTKPAPKTPKRRGSGLGLPEQISDLGRGRAASERGGRCWRRSIGGAAPNILCNNRADLLSSVIVDMHVGTLTFNCHCR